MSGISGLPALDGLIHGHAPVGHILPERPDDADKGPYATPSDRAEEDRATISEVARALLAAEESGREGESSRLGQQDLSPEEQEQVRKLEARDREVRAHENAHKAAAGDLAAGAPTYHYQTGPDGKRYAVGGEVEVRMREGRTPEETLRNAQRLQRAASAPADPSAQDRAVGARASAAAADARREIREQQGEGEQRQSQLGELGPSKPEIA